MSYTQKNRPLRLTTPLGPDVLLLERIRGEERVSQLFHFQLEMISEKTEIDPNALLGKKVSVEIDFGDKTRYISGIVSRFMCGERGPRVSRFYAEMVPELWLAGLMQNTRIFQQKTVSDILSKVLSDLGAENALQLSGTYEPRNYCVQYRETNLAFLSRLMEEEGIFYFHSHSSGSHKLTISDVSRQAPACPEYSTLKGAVDDQAPMYSNEPIAFGVVREVSVISGNITLWDHSFELPGKNLEAKATVTDGDKKLEVYDYPGEYAQRFDGVNPGGGDQASQVQKILDENARVAKIRAGEAGAQRTSIKGQSNCPMLTAGHIVTLEKHHDPNTNGDYFLTSVWHDASIQNYDNPNGEPFSYTNSFEAIPKATPYVPPRITPRPLVTGSQTATVVGPSGAEIFTDKYGRVKVQFHWDREGKMDSSSSCWIRVSTPWAGKNWGAIAIPRIGNEVIVDFLEGDPDQPIITGMVYNADQMPPYTLPDNMTQSGVKTRSTQKGSADNFNELRFEDKKDNEQIYLHAEKNFDAVIENDETRKIGFEKKDKGDQKVDIFNDQIINVGAGKGDAAAGSQTLNVYKDQKITLETGNQDITVQKGNRTVTLDEGNETVTIKKGNRSVSIDTGHDKLVVKTGNRTVSIDTGNDELTIKTGNLKTTLKTGNATLELDVGNATTKAKVGKISEEAMMGIEMKVGQNSIKIDQTGVTIKGMMVKVEGQVQTQIKGLMTQVNGDAMLQVKGGITMIN